MKALFFGFFLIFLLSTPAIGEDIMHATTEDISEFDKMLADEPMARPEKKPEKKSPMKPKEGDKPQPRANFHKGKNAAQGPMGRNHKRKGPPRDDRERGRRKPPPPKGGGPPPGGPPPPPNN